MAFESHSVTNDCLSTSVDTKAEATLRFMAGLVESARRPSRL